MRSRFPVYIHEKKDWPNFNWDNEVLLPYLTAVRHKQGRLRGYMEAFGFNLRSETTLQTLTEDVLKSSEIEGEFLNREEVRSSLARKLGLDLAGLVPSDRHVDGVVEMMLDATRNYKKPLSADRLYGWHSALFPSGRSGMHNITVGAWRKPGAGPMQVVSGAMGKEKVHFEAPDSKRMSSEMKKFLSWFNKNQNLDPVLKSALAHFWFVTVHPFDDGNGRMARALGDMLLARADEGSQRFYSMSTEIRNDRKGYYNILEKTQKGDFDVTEWLLWYLNCLNNALNATDKAFQKVLLKTKFWDVHANTSLNERQRSMINKLFDGFHGKLNSSKWAKMMKCSSDTALRDITDLLQKNILEKEDGGGRSTSYVLKFTE
jgi:Fic family protein